MSSSTLNNISYDFPFALAFIPKCTSSSTIEIIAYESSTLLRIPAELRLVILELLINYTSRTLTIGGCYSPCFSELSVPLTAFVDGGNIITSTSTTQAIRPIQPAISFVNRQIRAEALPIFYRQNRFLVAAQNRRARTHVVQWLNTIAPNPRIAPNLWNVAVKHRFGILDYRGTIEFDFKNFRRLICGSTRFRQSIQSRSRRSLNKPAGREPRL